MEIMKKVTQRLRQVRSLGRLLKEDGLINTTDLLVATGATVILASGVGSAVLGTLDDAKYGKAQPDAMAIAEALSQFFADTGKWPGQAEHANASDTDSTTAGKQVAAQFLVTTTNTAFFPINLNDVISVTLADCQNNSLQGFVGVDIAAGTLASAVKKNLNDYLVRKPSDTDYPNWQGPYIQTEITTDPWDRAWVLNLQPLYCSENVTGATDSLTGGKLGYAWLLSGGTNRTVSTSILGANLDRTGDDAGMNLGKLVTRGTGGLDAGS